MSNSLKKIGRGLSKVTAAVVEGVAGTLIGILVFNPAAKTIKVVRDFFNNINFTFLMEWLLAPLFWPVKDTLEEGFAEQAQKGWDEDFDWDIKARSRLANKNIYSRSDFIASLIIMGFVIAAIVAIFFPATFGVAALLPNIIAAVGLASLAPWALAIVVGFTGTLILSSLYTIGSIWFYHGFVLPSVLSGLDTHTNIFSRFAGAIVGAVWGTLSALVVYNPVTVLIDKCRKFWRDKDLPHLIIILLTLFYVIYGLLRGFAHQADFGWINGFQSAFHAHKNIYNDAEFAKRDIIAGWVITGLVTLVVLAVLFPATFGMASILPTIVAAIGLSSLNTAALAIIAGVASLILLTVAYGIGTALYDYQPAPKTHVEKTMQDAAAGVERGAEQVIDSATQAMRQLKSDVQSASKADDSDCLDSLWHGFKSVFKCLCPCVGKAREEDEHCKLIP